METIDDRHEIYRPYKAPCAMCNHDFEILGITCKAFPKGIPDEILKGENRHLQPLKGQKNDFVFLKIKSIA